MTEEVEQEDFNKMQESLLNIFRVRKQVKLDQNSTDNQFNSLKQQFTCNICLELFEEPVYAKVCSHRFCKKCIEKHLRLQTNKACPICRKKIASKRDFNLDENLNKLMLQIFQNIPKYKKLQDKHDIQELANLDLEQFRKMERLKIKNQQLKVKEYEKQSNLKQEPQVQVEYQQQSSFFKPGNDYYQQFHQIPQIPVQQKSNDHQAQIAASEHSRKQAEQMLAQQHLQIHSSINQSQPQQQSFSTIIKIPQPRQQDLQPKLQSQTENNYKREQQRLLSQLPVDKKSSKAMSIEKDYSNQTVQSVSQNQIIIKTPNQSSTLTIQLYAKNLFTRQLEDNYLRLPIECTIKDVKDFIIKKLNLNSEYSEYLDIYVQDQLQIPEKAIQQLNIEIWNHFSDFISFSEKPTEQDFIKQEKTYYERKVIYSLERAFFDVL